MFETETIAYDFALARQIAALLVDDGVPAVAEEFEIGMAHVRLDPEDEDPTGYIAVVVGTFDDSSETGEPGSNLEGDDVPVTTGEWHMFTTRYDRELHTYENDDTAPGEPLGVEGDAEPSLVADAIANFLA